ncbi:integral membrane protein [Blastomyces dermatitidis ATCC 18188]|uniref:Integral membrane protein n=2 Tax=Ajellomyces dermatitidis TaxID=5039 RepID=F2TTL4_AJEDA|nr:integral membrane protein [Blastomyces dermatitidis ATCC 18188]
MVYKNEDKFSFGVDDVWILLTMIPSTGLAGCVLTANISYGWDRHIWDLEVDKFKPGMQLATACYVLFALATSTTKLSLLAFYRRLLSPHSYKSYKWVILIMEILSVITALAYAFGVPFLCKYGTLIVSYSTCYGIIRIDDPRPIGAAWDFTPPLYRPAYNYHCTDRFTVTFAASILNAVLDFLTMLVPIPIGWQLQLPISQRLAVIAIFCVGAIVVAASCVKTGYIVTAMGESYDEQFDAYPLWIMSIVEIDLGIICASAPALRPLISRYIPKAFGTMSRSRFSRRRMPLSINSVALSDGNRYISDPSTYKPMITEKPRTAKAYSVTGSCKSSKSIPSIRSPTTANNVGFPDDVIPPDTSGMESEYDSISQKIGVQFTPSPTFPEPYYSRSQHSRKASGGSLKSYEDDVRDGGRSGSTFQGSSGMNDYILDDIDKQDEPT